MEDWSWTIYRVFVVRISGCQDYGKRGCENLSVCDHYGPNKQRRMLRCRTCKARFSERKGTPLFGANLPEDKVAVVLGHVAEGCGVRKTSRLTGVHKDTVTRYSRLAGGHAKQLHDELVAVSPETREVQFDEKWSFVNKKEKRCDPANPADARRGDNWDHVAVDPEHRLVVSVVPGKRTMEKVETLVEDFKHRTGGRTMNLITSDEYRPYLQVKQFDFAEDSLRRAIQLDDSIQAAHLGMIRVLADHAIHGQAIPRSAFRHITRALETGPQTADLFWNIAFLYATAARRDSGADSAGNPIRRKGR